MAERAVVFDTAFESWVRSYGPRVTPALREALRPLGVDLEHLSPAYPLADWDAFVRLTARTFFPDLADDAAHRRMGREFMQGYVQTGVGRAAMLMARVIGPRRMLERMGRNFRTAGNSIDAVTTVVGPNEVEVETRMLPAFLHEWAGRPSVMVHYRAGILEGSLDVIGASPEAEVRAYDVAAQVTRYRVRWR
jgi:uncharacterized protein (TIGR02265 family)